MLCVARRCGPAPGRRGWHARIVAAASASQPPCPSSAGRGERAGGPGTPIAAVRGSAAGAPSAMRQLGELSQETLALNPTKAGSAISRIVLSFRAKGAIVPAGCAAPAAALPLARTSRCARKRGFGWGCAYQASSTSTSRLCLLVGAAGGARPRGAARRRFLSGVGAARVTRRRADRGVPETGGRGCPIRSVLSPRPARWACS